MIYDFILKILKPFVMFTGKIYAPFSRKRVTGRHYYLIRDRIEVGTVLLARTRGEFSNLINPEKIKHASIYIGDVDGDGIHYVVEALTSGVTKTDLITFLTTKDLVIGCRPNFLTEADKVQIPEEAKRIIGIPYDFLFNKDAKAMYCFEAVAHVFKMIRPELKLKCKEIVKGKEIYSYQTFLEDRDLFDLVFDTRTV